MANIDDNPAYVSSLSKTLFPPVDSKLVGVGQMSKNASTKTCIDKLFLFKDISRVSILYFEFV